MAETFYTVLGVDADADADAIQHAYRERVKDHHPDVSDEADATERFKRLTEARDVLLDDARRSQYDRVGHATFVTRYLDSNAWTADEPTGSGRPGDDGRDRSETARYWRSRGTGDDDGGGWSARTNSGSSTGSGNASNYDRYRSSYATDHEDDGTDASSGRRRRRNPFEHSWASGGEDAAGDSDWGGESDASASGGTDAGGEGDAGWASDAGWTADGEDDTDAAGASGADPDAWADETDGDWGASAATQQSTRANRHRSDPRTRARADQWKTAHAAANVYRSTGTDTGTTATGGGATVGGIRRVVSELGPWLLVHFVFLLGAFVTVWLLLSWTPSVETMLLSLVLIGATVFFSILHLISRFYS